MSSVHAGLPWLGPGLVSRAPGRARQLRSARAPISKSMLQPTSASSGAETVPATSAGPSFDDRMIAASIDCIKVLDLHGRLLAMNESGMRALEICDIGPIAGSPWVSFWEGEDRESAQAAVEKARAGSCGHFVGYFPTRQTHQPRWWDVVVSKNIHRKIRQL